MIGGRPDVLGSLLNSAISGMFAGAAPPVNIYEGRRFPRGDPRNCLRNNPNLNIMHVCCVCVCVCIHAFYVQI